MMTVRKASADDVAALLPLISAYWEFEAIPGFGPRRVATRLERLLSDSNLGDGWIATDENRPVGYLLAVYVFSLEHFGLTAEIDELFVTTAGRSKGVGSELLSVAEAEFKRRGCSNVSLQLARGNDAGRRFYRRHGYAERSGFELLEKPISTD